MFSRLIVFAVVALVAASGTRYREYLEECVTSYKDVMNQVCPSSTDLAVPCLSDAVLQRKISLRAFHGLDPSSQNSDV